MPTLDCLKYAPQRVWIEICIRALVFIIFFYTENLTPFERVIQPEEYWLYKFPTQISFVPSESLYVIALSSISAVILISYVFNKDLKRVFCALAVTTLALPLNGIITNIIKISVGRPRPDFFNRCYGSNYINVLNLNKPCTGEKLFVLDGRKSFPSGHSSMSFCTLGFVFLYLASQLGTFVASGRGRSGRLLITISPLLLATLIAISRTCDYHHHWQDTTVGSVLGFSVIFVVYRQYFPSITDSNCHVPDIFSSEGDASRNFNRRGTLNDNPTLVKTV